MKAYILLVTFLTVTHSFAMSSGLVYQAHCLSLSENHAIAVVAQPRIVLSKKIESTTPQQLIQKCQNLQKADNKAILALDFDTMGYNLNGRIIKFLKDYMPATESNSAVILNDLPLLDELSE